MNNEPKFKVVGDVVIMGDQIIPLRKFQQYLKQKAKEGHVKRKSNKVRRKKS